MCSEVGSFRKEHSSQQSFVTWNILFLLATEILKNNRTKKNNSSE